MSPSNQPRNNRDAKRVSRRNLETATKLAGMAGGHNGKNHSAFNGVRKAPASTTKVLSNEATLKVVPLGGLGEVGRNMNIIEYGNDAIVVDAGFRLGIDLPGINFALPEFTYLEQIKAKVRGFVFTHGHLDHVGAMPFILSWLNAPVYGSRFTLDMLERQVADKNVNIRLEKRYINADIHEKVTIGPFTIELVRVTHSIPDATALAINTPVGRIVHTGDFKFDPEPLDGKLSDLERFKQLGNEGVLLLMADSTNCNRLGRTPSESNIEPALLELFNKADGRLIVSAVSTNINRIQMIMNAVVKTGRKICIDGRSMLANIELAVKNGFMRIPAGTVVPMRDSGKVPDKQLCIISTGHQGELNSVLMRMASGEHKFIKLKPSDTVILSASPIPGNEKAVVQVVDRILREGTKVFQHVTREIDDHGPLHVSGHGNQDELTEMMLYTKPKFFVPIHGEFHHQIRHAELALKNGIPKDNVFVLDNGDVVEISAQKAAKTGRVPAGTQLVDQTGALVPNLVIKDRLLMGEDGIVVAVLTLDRKTGRSLSSPDIITRGFIYIKDNEVLMSELRNELRRFTIRRFAKVDINRFKQELRDHITNFLFKHTQRTPIVIPVVNAVGSGGVAPAKAADITSKPPL